LDVIDFHTFVSNDIAPIHGEPNLNFR